MKRCINILDLSDMDSNSTYSQFIEHSFRRLTLLIHQQDDPDNSITNSVSTNKINEQSFNISSSSVNNKKNNINNNELVSFSSKSQYHQQSVNDNLTDSIESKGKVEPISKTHRTYMRPPKNRTTSNKFFISIFCILIFYFSVSYRSSSSQFSDRSEASFNHPLNSPCSPSIIQQKSNELPIHMPYESTAYDIKFERDRQNDVREKFNIPPPFQRKWLRQPRYVPQERPNVGQVQQSQNK
jgi:hypothetical protein